MADPNAGLGFTIADILNGHAACLRDKIWSDLGWE